MTTPIVPFYKGQLADGGRVLALAIRTVSTYRRTGDTCFLGDGISELEFAESADGLRQKLAALKAAHPDDYAQSVFAKLDA